MKNYDPSKVNLKYGNENSLHLLINILSPENYANVAECIKILTVNGCNPNFPNEKNQTPFLMLLKKQTKLVNQKELVEFFLENTNVDLYTYRQDEMVKLFKTQNSHRQMPEQQIQNIDPKFMMSLVINRKELDFESYFNAFKEACSNNSQNYHEECAKFLEMATIKGAPGIVEILLAHEDIDVNIRAQGATWNCPPSFIAVKQGYYEILKMFMRQPNLNFCFDKIAEFPLEKNSKMTLLNEVCLRFGADAANDKNVDFQKCFNLLINDPRCDRDLVINCQDAYGCTPLHYTTRYKNAEATTALMKKSAYICIPNNLEVCALRDLNKDVFEKFLDDCIVSVNRRIKKSHIYVYGYDEQELHIDYSFLKPPKSTGNCEILSLQQITKNNELRKLIKHPVLFSFLYIKWSKLSLLFYINFVMFSLFMLSLIAYIVLCQSVEPEDRKRNATYMFFYGISIASVAMLTIREILQCLFSVKHYFKSKMNWFEMTLIVLSWMVLFGNFSEEFQRILRGITILFAATEFLTLAGTLPNLSVSTHMVILKTVILTFLKSIALYSILLFGFGLCFYTLFGHGAVESMKSNSTMNQSDDDKAANSFYHPGIAIIKTFVMLTGEFEFGNLELNDVTNYTIFVLFVFLITIVLFNLLNALAVSDTQMIKSEGQLVDLIQRISVLNKYERIIFNGNSKIARWLQGTINVFPNWIPSGKVVIFPNQSSEIKTVCGSQKSGRDVGDEELQTLNNNNANGSKVLYENIIVNEWLPSKFQRPAVMDHKIMKSIKIVLEQKAERAQNEENELNRIKMNERICKDIVSIKMQGNKLQTDMRRIKSHLNI